jgi:hypothetical protein
VQPNQAADLLSFRPASLSLSPRGPVHPAAQPLPFSPSLSVADDPGPPVRSSSHLWIPSPAPLQPRSPAVSPHPTRPGFNRRNQEQHRRPSHLYSLL